MRFDFIAAEKAWYPVRLLCRCLGVARSGYYASRRRQPSLRSRHDVLLMQRLRLIHAGLRRSDPACGFTTLQLLQISLGLCYPRARCGQFTRLHPQKLVEVGLGARNLSSRR